MWRITGLGVCLCLLLAGCGGKAGASPAHTPTPSKPSPTSTPPPVSNISTSTPIPQPTDTLTPTPAPSPTRTPRPRPTSRPLIAAPRVLSADVSPVSAAPGGSLRMTVETTGSASKIELYLSSGPGGAGPLTYTLTQTTPGTWAGSGAAPAAPGRYHYSVGVYDQAGTRTIADNDGWNIQVGPAAPTGPQPLPGNIPLAPPFSYGNPVVARFTAEGKQVDGSAVVSNLRPDVSAAVVAQYYVVHLPRAGWTIDTGGIPPAGATAFSITATSGPSQVCVIQFTAGTVEIFYGSLSS